ncbi:unnamed protein product [Lampetra fluviatilis]
MHAASRQSCLADEIPEKATKVAYADKRRRRRTLPLRPTDGGFTKAARSEAHHGDRLARDPRKEATATPHRAYRGAASGGLADAGGATAPSPPRARGGPGASLMKTAERARGRTLNRACYESRPDPDNQSRVAAARLRRRSQPGVTAPVGRVRGRADDDAAAAPASGRPRRPMESSAKMMMMMICLGEARRWGVRRAMCRRVLLLLLVRWQRCRSDAKRLERRPMQCDNALEERLVASRRAFSRTLHSRVEGRAMRLGTSELQCLFTDGLKAIAALISEHRHELRICGWRRAGLAERQTTSGHRLGHVRHPGTDEGDVLSGRRSHHRRKVHEQSVEITTLRVDVTTDGRHAEVEFTTDWQTDSDGTLYEYFNGMEDQKNKKVRFVGDPEKSIQENYLHIVRYFRFYGSVHEPQTLAAIERDAGGRTGRHRGRAHLGGAEEVAHGTPRETPLRSHLRARRGTTHMTAVRRERGPRPVTLLSAPLRCADDVGRLDARLRLSKDERNLAAFVDKLRGELRPDADGDDPARLHHGLRHRTGRRRRARASRC